MKIQLLVPPRPAEQVLNLLPPYALGYLAAACRKGGHHPQIMDCALQGWNVDEAAQCVLRQNDSKAVGITMFSTDFYATARLCRELKRSSRLLRIILGGIHPSSYPEPTLQAIPEADFLFVGEAETGLPLLLNCLDQTDAPADGDLARIPGLAWRSQGSGILRVNPRVFPEDLDNLGMPAWDLLRPLDYQKYPPTLFVRQRPFAPIITTRGCPYHCTYCAGHNVSGYRIRNRSLNLVFEEISALRERYGIRELHIEDDNFTWDRKRVLAFCQGLQQRKWNLSWTMPNGVRLDTLDQELLASMKQAGCYFLILGVESGSDRVLEHMRKKITVRQVEEKARLVAQAGILPHAFFMLGYPTEKAEDIRATLDLALRLPLIGAHFSSFRPLPGTQISQDLISRGEVPDFDFSADKSTFASVLYAPPGLTIQDIKAWQKKMLLRFYLRPRILWLYLREMLRHPFLVINLFRKVWLYLFH